MADNEKTDYTFLTVQLLSAYVANNSVPSNELGALIQSTRVALISEDAPAVPVAEEFSPAVSVRKSIASSDHILSLIDGRPYKTLKRHLATHGLTPDSYRERFGLPKSYPMVAAGYSAQRRAVAQKIGLGQRGLAAQASAAAALEAPKESAPAEPKSSRKPRAKGVPATAQAAESPAAVAPAPAKAPRKARTIAKPAAKEQPDAAATKESAPKTKAASAAASSSRKKLGISTAKPKSRSKDPS